jgi:hypothetical protein
MGIFRFHALCEKPNISAQLPRASFAYAASFRCNRKQWKIRAGREFR